MRFGGEQFKPQEVRNFVSPIHGAEWMLVADRLCQWQWEQFDDFQDLRNAGRNLHGVRDSDHGRKQPIASAKFECSVVAMPAEGREWESYFGKISSCAAL